MPDSRPPRASCLCHGRYNPRCPDCKAFRQIYDRWHRRPMTPDGLWAFRLSGDFEQPGEVHTVLARDEMSAYERAAWWRKYRADVRALVLTRAVPLTAGQRRAGTTGVPGWVCAACRVEPWTTGNLPGGMGCGCDDKAKEDGDGRRHVA